MDKKFACYTPSPYFDFRECQMHNNPCSPTCDCHHCKDFCSEKKTMIPPCEKKQKPPCFDDGFCKISPCMFWFVSGIVFYNLIHK